MKTHSGKLVSKVTIGRRFGIATRTKTGVSLTVFLLLAVIAVAISLVTVSSAKMTKNADDRERAEKRKERAESRLAKSSKEVRLEADPPQTGETSRRFDMTPTERHLIKSGKQFDGDLRSLPQTKQADMWRPEHEPPEEPPLLYVPPGGLPKQKTSRSTAVPAPAAPAPTPLNTFPGLGRPPGNGFPPDTNGDVGPNHYIQTINTSIGIFDKTTGALTTSFSFNTFMSQGAFGNLCDTNNFGDPVVLYDTFEDRWVITDFAFQLDGSNNVITPPGSFQCFAVSKTADPVAGGWNFYSIQQTDGLNDYPKFGIWPDGIYMTANMFGLGGLSAGFEFSREWAFNKTQMYAGAANPQIVTFDAPRIDQNGGTVFTAIPSNARLQTGSPPAGTPNYFAVTGTYTNALSVWKFHVDWGNVFASTFTGATTPLTGSTWIGPPATVPSQGGNNLDTLATRAMMQNQYTNLAGAESLWLTHTVRNSTTVGVAAARWYQLDVTGTTIAANTTQAANHEPDTTINRFMPSIGVDRAGNTMLGYSASSAAIKPAIRYAGRFPGDPLSTLPQTEVDLIQGTGTQVGNCGGATCTRWGDYSAMSLDPNGCTYWFTSEYYAVDGLNYLTRIGSIAFPSCTPVGAGGTVQGTVTVNPGGAPISGATINFGSRTTTTNGSGFYSFSNIPAGTYPSISASAIGFNPATTTPVVVTDGGTTVDDFALTAIALSACLVDTTQADFSLGTPTTVDEVTSPGNVTLQDRSLDQQQPSFGGNGVGINLTTWGGQTFIPAVTGLLTRADINLFCSGCTGTTPTLTLSVRNTAANVPTGADIASTTLSGFSSGAAIFYTGTFSSPATLTAGTKYALIIRPTAAPSAGTYALTRTGSSTTGQSMYANGDRVSSLDSGGTWTINTTGGIVTDAAFRTFMTAASGNLVSAIKDANPPTGMYVHWFTLSWNATVPANTTLAFQVAGSNNPAGPFNFVGPDNTAGTFFTTSPSNITLLNGNRYLKYKAFFTRTDPAVTPTVSDVTVCYNTTNPPTAAPAFISGKVTRADGSPLAGVTMNLGGARSTKVITDAQGNYRFNNVDTDSFYTVTPSILNYHFSPEILSFSLLANKSDASFTATHDAMSQGNVIDTADYFVRQHYVDFLGREPDESGLLFWSDQIIACGADAACTARRTINVSAAYFLSIEFMETGGLVDGLYRASYNRRAEYAEFMPDTATVARNVIVGQGEWRTTLDGNKQAFVDAWVARPEFRTAYDGLGNAAYVDTLISHAGGFNGDRDVLVNGLNTNTLTRAAALRAVAENQGFASAKRNGMFVMMEYFGYLRRDPDEAGFNFWLNKLNQHNGNFEQAEMVKSFIVSGEYRNRFINQ
jgi:hypothetical protein